MIALLIVTVIGSGGPLAHRGAKYHPLPLRNATVFVVLPAPNPPLFSRKTNKQGSVAFHFAPGRYQVSAELADSSPPLRCQKRTVTMTGATQKVKLVCQIS